MLQAEGVLHCRASKYKNGPVPGMRVRGGPCRETMTSGPSSIQDASQVTPAEMHSERDVVISTEEHCVPGDSVTFFGNTGHTINRTPSGQPLVNQNQKGFRETLQHLPRAC